MKAPGVAAGSAAGRCMQAPVAGGPPALPVKLI